MLIAKCEHCGAVEQVPDSYAGKTLECECGHDVVVPFPKTRMQSIVLFDPPSQEPKDNTDTTKSDECQSKLPNDNRLTWVSNMCYFFGGLGVFATIILFGGAASKDNATLWSIFGMTLGATIWMFVCGAVVQTFGSIELNTRVNNELLAAMLKQLEKNSEKNAK